MTAVAADDASGFDSSMTTIQADTAVPLELPMATITTDSAVIWALVMFANGANGTFPLEISMATVAANHATDLPFTMWAFTADNAAILALAVFADRSIRILMCVCMWNVNHDYTCPIRDLNTCKRRAAFTHLFFLYYPI